MPQFFPEPTRLPRGGTDLMEPRLSQFNRANCISASLRARICAQIKPDYAPASSFGFCLFTFALIMMLHVQLNMFQRQVGPGKTTALMRWW